MKTDRVSRIEGKVEKLTVLMTEVLRDLKEIKGGRPQPQEAPKGPPEIQPDDYYGAYCFLFDEWTHGNRRLVDRKLREMTLEQVQGMVKAAQLPIEDISDQAAVIKELHVIFDGLEKKSRAEQFAGLCGLLSQEWAAGNIPFVEGRLNELSTTDLRIFAGANDVPLSKNARRDVIIKALMKDLEKRRPAAPATQARKHRKPKDEAYTYMHSVLFEEWNHGNRDYVKRQLESLDPDRLKAFIKANKLPVNNGANREKALAEISAIYDKLKVAAKSEQYAGLRYLLAQEWNCGNRAFVERRLNEMDEESLRVFAEANGVAVPAKAGKPAIVKAVKETLKTVSVVEKK